MLSVILIALLATTVSATDFQDCGSQASDVIVNVEGCEGPPCVLIRGTTMNVQMLFSPSRDSETLTIVASANIGGIDVPWPGIDTNACLYTTCPITQGVTVDWNMPVEILAEYPSLSTTVKFALKDSTGEEQVCSLFAVYIV